MRRIQRRRTKGYRLPPNAVYVGRPTVYGNPYRAGEEWLGRPMTPKEATQRYGQLLALGLSPEFALRVEELRRRDLACWCPLEDENGNRFPCHADVLLELANR